MYVCVCMYGCVTYIHTYIHTLLFYFPAPEERGVVLREQAAGFYPVSAYYMARMTSELPVVILLPCCFLIPVYWIVGLNGPLGFFGSMLTISLVTLSSQVNYA